MPPARSVRISCYQQGPPRADGAAATVCIDVLRAMTTAVTAVDRGRRCYPVPSLEAAVPLAAALHQPLLVGELGGSMPYGFDLQNSPAAIERRSDLWRPMILLSTAGTALLGAAAANGRAYAACLRNWSATAEHAAQLAGHVDVVGAGARGEFRREDELCCAWIAERLMAAGAEPVDAATEALVQRWTGADVGEIARGRSADYLRETGQTADLEFVLAHVDDLDAAYAMHSQELTVLATTAPV
jgi:2-phosphosulfolactate phosphatase